MKLLRVGFKIISKAESRIRTTLTGAAMAEKWVCQNYGGGGYKILDRTGKRICEVFATDQPRDKGVKTRNARLITAAPELLQSLKDLVENGINRKTFESAIAAISRTEDVG